MGNQTGACRRPAGAAFTLIELLLTVTLLLLLAAAAVVNFDSFQRGSKLDEGATLVESLFRYTRAQSSSSGRTLRLIFEDPSGTSAAGSTNASSGLSEGMQVVWETDPLNAPGRFEVMREAAPFTDRLNDLVEVRRVRSPQGSSEALTNRLASATSAPGIGTEINGLSTGGMVGGEDLAGGSGRPPIVFYPDGSSDSVEVLLVSKDPEDTRQMVLTLSGVVGLTRRRWLTVDASGRVDTEAATDLHREDKQP